MKSEKITIEGILTNIGTQLFKDGKLEITFFDMRNEGKSESYGILSFHGVIPQEYLSKRVKFEIDIFKKYFGLFEDHVETLNLVEPNEVPPHIPKGVWAVSSAWLCNNG